MVGVDKRFGDVWALESARLQVESREVHGLLGGNGAGKTTLMNVLYGLYKADAGQIEIDGVKVDIRSPRDAISRGVGMVHQTFLQVDTYTVTENVVLGTSGIGSVRLDLRSQAKRIFELSEQFGLTVNPDAVVEDLPVGIRQRVEILKSLYRGCRTLVLDEPTTNLTPQEVDRLFGSITSMVNDGMSVILITHKIRETMSVCDRMTVMRGGRDVATLERSATNPDELAAIMVGDQVSEALDDPAAIGVEDTHAAVDSEPTRPARACRLRTPTPTRTGGVVASGLTIANDHGVTLFHDFDLTVGAGEVVGIAGVAGNGQVELAEALSGVRPLLAGSVRLHGNELAGRRSADWLTAGIAYVPEDRHRDGILSTRSITDNLLLGSQRDTGRYGSWLLDWKRARQRAAIVIQDYSIMTTGPGALAGDLSGGNMQRVILARAFQHEPELLVLHNPSRGLDIASTQFVHRRIREAAASGCSVLLLSEDLDEVIALSHRLHVLFAGRLAGEWARKDADRYEIGRAMAGIDTEP